MASAGYKQQNFVSTLTGDQGCAVNVWYNGTDGVAEITVSGAPLFTFQIGGVNDARVNPGGGTPGLITDAEAPTLGGLVALINASASPWRASLCSAFSDGDTTDVLAITETTVGPYGITAGTGARLGGIAYDYSDLSTVIQLCCLGREADASVRSDSRFSASNIRRTRDIADSPFVSNLVPQDTVARLFRLAATIGDAGTGPLTITIYSANQADTRATARILWTRTYTEDTQAIDVFDPPADLVSDYAERIIVEVSSGAALDAINVVAVGGYGD